MYLKKLGIPTRTISEAVKLAKSKRVYNESKDFEFVIELNALIHTDFTSTPCRRSLKIHCSTTHIGQVIFFDTLMERHGVQPVNCIPIEYGGACLKRLRKEQWFGWRIYTLIDESFSKALTTD